MKGVCLILALVACAAALSTVDHEWEAFKTKFGKQYSTEEEARRHKIFQANKKLIETHNKKFDEGKVTFTMGVNKFADMTVEDTSYLRGYKQSPGGLDRTNPHVPSVGVKAPATVDWRDEGYVTGVKDQGQCGSCWSFSATGSLEGQHFAATGDLVSLSEQNLVDCVTGDNCNGGLMTDAFAYIHRNGGIDTEESYPYTATNGLVCKYTVAERGATCTGYKTIAARSEDDLLDATAAVGPISVAIDASHVSFQLYNSGVYYESACSQIILDHGVLVVGYGTEALEEYWLVKNSWGTSWGEKGYLKMARNRDNNCGIASEASYPTV